MKRFTSRQMPSAGGVPRKLLAVSIAAGALSSSMVVAQDDSDSQSVPGFGIEEVVVSARKIKESTQDAPLSVSAFSADSMKSLGVTNLKEFDGIVPGLNMGGGGNGVKGDSNPYIRGVGQRETKVTIDGAVATYVDGVYVGRAAGALLDAVDVASIEVLRGPQGTLFGKNTTGGAIVIQTAKPGPEFGGHVNATLGNYGRRNASATVNVPITDDTLFTRFTVASTKNDGYTENQVDGSNWTDDDRMMGIAQLRWMASDSLMVDSMLSATKTRQRPRGQKCLSLAQEYDALGGITPKLEDLIGGIKGDGHVQAECNKELSNDEFESELASNTPFGNGAYEVDTMMASVTLDWTLTENLGFKSISAWRRTEQLADEDLDGSGLALVGRKQPHNNRTDQYSQEFQFLGDTMDGRLRYVAGLYGFWERTDDDALQDYSGFVVDEQVDSSQKAYILSLPQSQYTVRDTDNAAWSAFGQIYFDITEHIELTVGLRYTDETRKTKYKEGVFFPESIYTITNPTGAYTPCTNANLLTQCQVTTALDGGLVINPFNEWQYGFDINQDDIISADEVGQIGKDEGDRKDSAWTPTVSIKFLATDEILDALQLDDGMMFFTYSEGFRSGGVTVANGDFSGSGIKDLENFEPEYVTNYEVGIKLDALDRRLRSNFALFFTDYEDIQVTTVIAEQTTGLNLPLPAVENAGKAEIKGVEGEITFLATQNLRFMLNFAYTDARYLEYTVDSSVLGTSLEGVERADEPMPRVADWTGFLSADYTIMTDNWGMVIPSINLRYSDEIYHGFDRDSYLTTLAGGDLVSEEVVFVGARVAWMLPDDRTTVTFWGKNLTDEDSYLVGGVPLVSVARSSGVVYADPKTYGIDISYRFGDE